MADQIKQASFIPKKPLGGQGPVKVKRKKAVSISTIIASVLFVASIGLAIGVFFYDRAQTTALSAKKLQLSGFREVFDSELIGDLASLDTRIKSAEAILDGHIALTPFFSLLEELTLKTVQFNSFTFKRSNTAQIDIIMTGAAESFTSIALQSDSFSDSAFISSPLFANFGLNDEDRVMFDMVVSVSRSLLLYKGNE